jgi:poly(glycerol-phosphate) alpha-glucosyltransferase
LATQGPILCRNIQTVQAVVEQKRAVRIAMVTASMSRQGGGLFYAVRPLARALAEQGTPVEVMGLRDRFWEQDESLWRPVRASAYPAVRGIPIGYSPQLRQAVSALDVSEGLFHLHGLWLHPSKVVLDASRRTGRPRIISPHGMLDAWAVRNSGWKKKLVGKLYEDRNLAGCQCLHALCEAERQSIREFGLKNPVAVVPNGIDLPPEAGSFDDPAPVEWRNKKVLLFMGRIHPKKGLEPLIEAWRLAGGEQSDWRLAAAGPNELNHQDQLQSKVESLGLQQSIRFVGPQAGKAKDAWLRRASAFALTSFSEGFSMAILEAMAYGLPVLISPQCNFPEAAAAGAALSAEPNAEEIALQLRPLFQSTPAELSAMGQRGKNLVGRDFTWRRVAEQMNEVYQWLLGRSGRPSFVWLD